MRVPDARLLKAADDAVAFVWAETGLRYPVQLLLLQALDALGLLAHLAIRGDANITLHVAVYWLCVSVMRWGRMLGGDTAYRWFREWPPGTLVRIGLLLDVLRRSALCVLAGNPFDGFLAALFLGFWFFYWGIPPKKRPPKKEREELFNLGLQGTA